MRRAILSLVRPGDNVVWLHHDSDVDSLDNVAHERLDCLETSRAALRSLSGAIAASQVQPDGVFFAVRCRFLPSEKH